MIDHQLISNRMSLIYERACKKDFDSPRCQFFRYEFSIYTSYLNPYNVYETCIDTSSQAKMLKQYLSKRNSEVRDDVIVTKKGVKGLS